MDPKVNYTVGLFVLILSSVMVAAVLWLASGGGLGKRYEVFQAIVNESVSGLSVSAPVKYNGVDVGKVQDIRLDRENPERVQLLFAIEEGTPVKQDTEAVLKTQGLTGIAYVELSGGSRDSPLLKAQPGEQYATIRTKPSLSSRIENVITSGLASLDRTSNNINAILSNENQAAIRSTLANLAVVARTIADRKQTLDATIVNAGRTFETSTRVVDQLVPVIERIGRSADAIEKMANEAERAAALTGRTVDAVGPDVKRFTAETLPELERLLGEARVLAASLRRLSEKIEGSPGGLLYGKRPIPPGPGEVAPR